MLTKEASRLAILFLSAFFLALILGNFIVLYMGLVPLFAVLLGLLLDQPRGVEIRRREIKRPIWVGEVIEVSLDVTIKNGIGMVALADQLPPEFDLVEGNNFRVCFKGLGRKSLVFSYKVKCPKRGTYTIPGTRWESRHILGLTQVRAGSEDTSVELLVTPRVLNIRRIRGMRGIASSPFPVIDVAKMGVTTTDFREIREYTYGDSIKAINWKATARQTWRGASLPLTNEYEVEGKKAVWIFLDASSSMEMGTTIENAFERALEAAGAVSFYFLERGYRLGMYVYNDGGRLFYPDAGKRQYLKLSRELVGLKTSERQNELPEAVGRCKTYILGLKPLCIIITRLDGDFSESLREGAEKLTLLTGRRRRRLPIMVISVAGYNFTPRGSGYERNAATFLYLKSRPLVHQLRRRGISVLEWNPNREGFATALLRQVKTR